MNESLALVRFKNPDAVFYWVRLVKSIQLKNAIDDGAYGTINWYSATSHPGVEAGIPVNILPRPDILNRNGIPQPGLRHGVLFTIYGSYRWLIAMGYEEEVKTLLDHDRHPQI